ncbi:MAG: Glutamine-scyllo-inositol transaminase [Parcubacteria group bacterium GW2011_GWA2_51_12]|nr:MAG: Glutamine-scyllo-inositol transaminase [Parcubacteria group bacterium GW2011_GWA2_51_12]
MIPYGRQTIDKKDISAVVRILRSPYLTQGPKIAEFENSLAKYCGAKYAVAVSHGTAALYLAYLASGLQKGDEVIVTPNTFVATTNMLLAVGAKPVFCDIRLDTYNLDERQIEKLVTKKTRAIVAVDFAGQPCDYRVLAKVARKHRLLLIADASHSLGASIQGKKTGSLADMTIFSFHPVKSITTGEGGAVLTNNAKFYRQLLSLRSHGIHKDKDGSNVMTEMGFNYRITDIQAALGISQLRKLNSFVRARRQVVSWYKGELRGLRGIVLPEELSGNYSAWHLYIVRVSRPAWRGPLRDYLKSKGIGVNFHYPAVYSHPFYRKLGFGKKRFRNEEIYARTSITLPCYPGLKKEEVHYISSCIKTWLQNN